MNEMINHIGEAVRQLRKPQGLSGEVLADLAEVQPKTIYRLENSGNGRIETIEIILGAMGYELGIQPISGRK